MRSIVAAFDQARKTMPRRQERWRSCESQALDRLLASREQLLQADGSRIDTKTEAGFHAANNHLENLDGLCLALSLSPCPRKYRHQFTMNYRALFPDDSRSYRVDIFEAAAEQESVIWVNGDKFEFSREAMRLASELERAWSDLDQLLERLRGERPLASTVKAELLGVLVAVDQAWANFEHRYISELIEIEEQARRLVVQAVEHEHKLRLLEKSRGDLDQAEYQEQQGLLVQCISRLNSVANFKRKGRSDLEVAVLHSSEQVLVASGPAGGRTQASQVLAEDVVESFRALRGYLWEVADCLERVDPHLCNNPGLVARLVDWEESWEVAAQYVQQDGLHLALCSVVDEIRDAQAFAPELAEMCEACDVELFMVLPRIAWLGFLSQPTRQAPLIRQLLPGCLPDPESCSPGAGAFGDGELRELACQFQRALQLLLSALSDRPAAGRAAWETLVRRAVAGSSASMPEVYGRLQPGPAAEAAEQATEAFMHEMERWSIDLQRHCPSDWNQFSAVLLRCLSGGPEGKDGRGDAFTI